jgi:hypothetical protein
MYATWAKALGLRDFSKPPKHHGGKGLDVQRQTLTLHEGYKLA